MKKHLKTCILFLLCFLMVFGICNIPFYPCRDFGYEYKNILAKEAELPDEPEDTIDVVLLGDSVSWAGYSPLHMYQEYGFTVYNCSTAGQWAGDSLIVLKKELEYQSPSVVVIDASCLYTRLNRYRYLLTLAAPVLHYHDAYLTMSQISPASTEDKGSNMTTDTSPYTGSTDYMNGSDEPQAMYSLVEEKLNAIKELCDEQGITLVVSALPAPLSWNAGKHAYIEQWASAQGVSFIDFNTGDTKLDIDWQTETRDGGDHLNLYGAVKASHALGEFLTENLDLPDHRNDSAYSSWTQLAAEYTGNGGTAQ